MKTTARVRRETATERIIRRRNQANGFRDLVLSARRVRDNQLATK